MRKNNGNDNKLPLLGYIAAGEPIVASENIIDEFPNMPGFSGDFFLKVVGDSMEPIIPEGSCVLVEKCSSIESGKIAVVMIDQIYAVLKRIYFDPYGVILRSENSKYEPIFIQREKWDNESILIGKVTMVMKSLDV